MMHEDVLYLHPYRNKDENIFLTIPMGLIGIVNNLIHNGISVKGYNIPLERKLNLNFSVSGTVRNSLAKYVLIDLHWYEHSYGAIDLARIVKLVSPEKKVILGGLTATIFCEQILSHYDCIDFVLSGEAEISTLELIRALEKDRHESLFEISGLCYRFGGVIRKNQITYHRNKDIDGYCYINVDWLNNKEHYFRSTASGIGNPQKAFWLLIASGCIYDCSYCGGGKSAILRTYGRTNITVRSYVKVVEDIIQLVKSGIDIIKPSHDFSMLGREYWMQLLQGLMDNGVKPGLYHECFQCPSIDFIRAIYFVFDPNRTVLVFSPLTASEEHRRKNGKFFSNRKLLECLAECNQLGIRAELAFSENLPGTTSEYANDQKYFLEEIYKVYPGIGYYSTEIALDPNSNMSFTPKDFGITVKFSNFLDYYNYTSKIGKVNVNGYTNF